MGQNGIFISLLNANDFNSTYVSSREILSYIDHSFSSLLPRRINLRSREAISSSFIKRFTIPFYLILRDFFFLLPSFPSRLRISLIVLIFRNCAFKTLASPFSIIHFLSVFFFHRIFYPLFMAHSRFYDRSIAVYIALVNDGKKNCYKQGRRIVETRWRPALDRTRRFRQIESNRETTREGTTVKTVR